MKKKLLNLPSPTPEEIERKEKKGKEDAMRVKQSFGRRGVGYVTPPPMDAILGVVDPGGEVEEGEPVGMREVEGELGGDELEASQEILDFRSPQPCMSHFSPLFYPSDVQSVC